jgi:hypothetical protein
MAVVHDNDNENDWNLANENEIITKKIAAELNNNSNENSVSNENACC